MRLSAPDPSETLVRAQRNAYMLTVKALVQQAGFEGLLVPDYLWRLRDGIIVAPATGDFADLVGEKIGTGRVRRQVVRIEGATAAEFFVTLTASLTNVHRCADVCCPRRVCGSTHD
jgi:hypothetical protein